MVENLFTFGDWNCGTTFGLQCAFAENVSERRKKERRKKIIRKTRTDLLFDVSIKLSAFYT